MAVTVTPKYDADGRRLCKTNGCVGLVTPCSLKARRYICSNCRRFSPAHQRARLSAQKTYRESAKGRAAKRRYQGTDKSKTRVRIKNARRIWIGRTYHSAAASVAEAQRIKAHIKTRLNAFERQQAGT